ncbi:hypothetical protein NDU88_006194 [Pleurodeles waltl]|uniref:Uncharacterized protein n=1 Tax=Pleurodeles waltl TaxID=8319 RepID=A0AAV7X0K0_PLEWA|nr:hypothetical protein NDU88_006194 [Pleurodeles waltl]
MVGIYPKEHEILANRDLESPATLHITPGAECRFPDPCGHDNKDIGNPDERIPETIPENHGDGDAIAITGNPDIRVPDIIEGDDGLRARSALTTEDAEKEDAEEGDAEKGGRTRKPPGRTQEEEQKDTSPGDTSTGQEGPEECERRHVPGGTWLSQAGQFAPLLGHSSPGPSTASWAAGKKIIFTNTAHGLAAPRNQDLYEYACDIRMAAGGYILVCLLT